MISIFELGLLLNNIVMVIKMECHKVIYIDYSTLKIHIIKKTLQQTTSYFKGFSIISDDITNVSFTAIK